MHIFPLYIWSGFMNSKSAFCSSANPEISTEELLFMIKHFDCSIFFATFWNIPRMMSTRVVAILHDQSTPWCYAYEPLIRWHLRRYSSRCTFEFDILWCVVIQLCAVQWHIQWQWHTMIHTVTHNNTYSDKQRHTITNSDKLSNLH